MGESSSIHNGQASVISTATTVAFLAGIGSAIIIQKTFGSSYKKSSSQNSALSEERENVHYLKSSDPSWIESVKHRIGELPLPRKRRWPWDKLPRKNSMEDNHNNESTSSSQVKDLNDDPHGNNSSPQQEKKELCIGSIFGLDVGGTLAKLVYFEQRSTEYHPETAREKHYHQAASALAVEKARRSRSYTDDTFLAPNRAVDTNGFQHHQELHLHQQQTEQVCKITQGLRIHSKLSEQDLSRLGDIRQESLPDNLDQYAEICNLTSTKVSTHATLEDIVLGESRHEEEKEEPITKGEGFLRRPRSMFDLTKSRDHAEALDRFYTFARRLDTYETAVKEQKLSFYSRELGGEFHFIQFETRQMENAMDLIRFNNLHLNIREMGATGGGAHKYAADWQRVLGIEMMKRDELDSLVAGMQFVISSVVGECYTYRPRKMPKNTESQQSDGSQNQERIDDTSPDSSSSVGMDIFGDEESDDEEDIKSRVDDWWWSRKVKRDAVSDSTTYPYLLVTIGTGVSILRVDGPRKHERVSGSTIGGGTYWGLIRLLTDVDDFEGAMKLAENGDPSKVDMMVGDIYGHNSDALEKVGLPSNLVASSFGKLVAKEDPSSGLKQEDLARALLLMVTNNIGQVSYLNAQLHSTNRIYFVGNFLRRNRISQRRLAFAIDYWSKGQMEALFLEHEGYFGALGAFLLNQKISHSEDGVSQDTPLHRRRTISTPRQSASMI